MTRQRSESEPSPFENALAIMRQYGDARTITTKEVGMISHYVMLHAQEKGISEEEAMKEVASELQKSASASSPAPPETAIHSYTIAIVTDPIPSIGKAAREGIAKVNEPAYVNSMRNLVRKMLADNGLERLVNRLSVHPIEVHTALPQTKDYMHIVELAGGPEAIALAERLWPSARTH